MVTPDDGTVRFSNTCRVRGQKATIKVVKKQCICWFKYLIKKCTVVIVWNQIQMFSGIKLLEVLAVCLFMKDCKLYALLTLALTTHWKGPGFQPQWGLKFSVTVNIVPEAHPDPGYRLSSRNKTARAWRWPPIPSSTKVVYCRAIPLSPLRTLMAYYSVTFTFTYIYKYFTRHVQNFHILFYLNHIKKFTMVTRMFNLDFRLPPRCWWNLWSSGLLHGVVW